MIYFMSDYMEGCHPAVLQRLVETNLEQNPGYGKDVHCLHATEMIRETFGCPQAEVHFLVGGTQVNTTVIAAILRPWEGALCADTGHIGVHESGAIESSGHKVLPLPGCDGKITGQQVLDAVALHNHNEHEVKPGMVYISMSTENGTLYSRTELETLYAACREAGLPLYIDGARLGYALTAEANDLTPEVLAKNCDIFTVGGTKCGMLFGEAAVFTAPALANEFRYIMKQRGGMLAKGRLLGIQFEALMQDGLYFEICRHANEQAAEITEAMAARGITEWMHSPTNQRFFELTDAQLEILSEEFVL